MSKRGRPAGQWPQRHLRVAAEAQELQAVCIAVPDTRQRTIVLLATPDLADALALITANAREIWHATDTIARANEPGSMIRQSNSIIARQAKEIYDLATEARAVLRGEETDE